MSLRTLLHYEFLLWFVVSIGLFVLVIPANSETLIKLIAAYVGYAIVRGIVTRGRAGLEIADRNGEALKERLLRNQPPEVSYIHDPKKNEELRLKTKRDIDIGSYL